MRFLLFVNVFLIFSSLLSEAQIPLGEVDKCVQSSVPKFTSVLYGTSIDVAGHHISGLLFLKTMPDSSQRAVFTSETGVTFFDFEWNKKGDFKSLHAIKKLKKKLVLNTLRKDFELLVVPASLRNSLKPDGSGKGHYSGKRNKETLKFKIEAQCRSVSSVEVMGKKSKLVDSIFFPEGKNIPDSVSIVHHNFNMKISLKRIPH